MGLMVRRILLLFALAFLPVAAAAQNVCIISGRGFFRINVEAGGLFAVFAHDHVIDAGKIEGCATQSAVKLSFSTSELKVLDPKESAENRAKIQKTMETEVLRIADYPKITFESTGVAADSAGKYRVSGNLTIRGKSSPVVIPVVVSHLDDGTWKVTGNFKFKQTTFGIEPIKLIGGTVRVKDELETEWELFLK